MTSRSDRPRTSPDWAQSGVRLVAPQPPSTPTTDIPAPRSVPTFDHSALANEVVETRTSPRPVPSRRMTLPTSVELTIGKNQVRLQILGSAAGWEVRMDHWEPGYAPTIVFQTKYNDGNLALETFRTKLTALMDRLLS